MAHLAWWYICNVALQLARAGSAAVKELVEATYQLQDKEHFVVAVKSTLQAITPFVGALITA
jgi:hypothetical protein